MDLAGTIVVTNGGYFSRSQALQCGETDRSLRRAVRGGEVVRLRHGMYAPAASYAELDDAARHLVLARAVLGSQRGAVALTGPSAALLHGFDVWGHDLSVVHLLRLDGGAGRREAGVVHHHSAPEVAKGVGAYAGLRAVSPAHAVWEVARLSSLESAVVTADSALHQASRRETAKTGGAADEDGVALADQVATLAERCISHPRGRTARLALRLARPEAESPGESLTRVACFRHGIPAPELQYEVVDGDGQHLGRSDFYWEKFRHLAEFDGRIKYERLLRPGQSASDCVVSEKQREDAMRGTLRGMTRLVWSEVLPGAAAPTMQRLRRDLERSRTLYVRG